MKPHDFPLFDQATPSKGTESDTRREARENVEPGIDGMRGEVLAALIFRSERGGTDEELTKELGMRPDTQRARRVELRDAGLVRDSGRRRATSSGREATVWIATTAAVPPATATEPARGSAPILDPPPPKTGASADLPAKSASLAKKPLGPCHWCGGSRWWRSIYGVLVCETCHPPATPELVAQRIKCESTQ